MMKCLYLLSVVFHVAAGCDLSGDNNLVINGHQGDSMLLPCSCSDLRTKPQTFTWRTLRTKIWTDVLNDEHYQGRLQLFNNISPGNLSLLISDLRVEDGVYYRCRTEKGYRDMTITVKGRRKETSTKSGKTDRSPPSEQTPSKPTNSPPTSSSSTRVQGCDLSGDNNLEEITQHQGGSVMLPCSCSDLHTKPQTFTWEIFKTGLLTDVLNDEHYHGRLQQFNNISPGNLSLLISDLREEDQRVYRCSTEKEHRDFWIYVKGCDLSANSKDVYNGLQGGSVLLLCSCSNLRTKPKKFTWTSYRTGRWTDVLNDEHYRGRFQQFNNISPGNLSLLISDLREEDGGDYRCSTEKEHRDMKINVKGRRRETSTRLGKTDRRPPSEQTPSKPTNSPPTSSSTTRVQVFGILVAFLLVIVSAVAFICWRCKGGRCGEKVSPEGCLDYKIKLEDQIVSDATLFTTVIYTCYSTDPH